MHLAETGFTMRTYLITLLLAAACYVGAYCALVEIRVDPGVTIGMRTIIYVTVEYKAPHPLKKICSFVFEPIHQVDVWIRPSVWNPSPVPTRYN